MKRDEDLKLREKALENLRIKGAFAAQELYDRHRGNTYYGFIMDMCYYTICCFNCSIYYIWL